jgi:hypothetical protein
MASPFNPNDISEMGFTPLDLVDVTDGRFSAKLYPKITSTMQIFDRTHAWQINKAALFNLPADFKLVIDAFGAQKTLKRYLINHLISTMLSGQCFVFLFRQGTERPHQGA